MQQAGLPVMQGGTLPQNVESRGINWKQGIAAILMLLVVVGSYIGFFECTIEWTAWRSYSDGRVIAETIGAWILLFASGIHVAKKMSLWPLAALAFIAGETLYIILLCHCPW